MNREKLKIRKRIKFKKENVRRTDENSSDLVLNPNVNIDTQPLVCRLFDNKDLNYN